MHLLAISIRPLRLRASTPLFALGSARLIQDKLSFPGSGFAAPPGIIVMLIDDTRGGHDVDPELDAVLVVINASGQTLTQPLPELVGRDFRLSPIQAEGADEVVRRTGFDRANSTMIQLERALSQPMDSPVFKGFRVAFRKFLKESK